MEMDYKIIIEKIGNKDNWIKKDVHWSVRLSFGECCRDNRSNTGQTWWTNGISSVKKEPVYCYHRAGRTEWWRTVEVSFCTIVIVFFFFLILVSLGCRFDLQDWWKYFFFKSQLPMEMDVANRNKKKINWYLIDY